ncbi:PPE domain-containing protein [Actinokineospora pegani]|uniref:PPE domain-containing protein n=1 Tax=Actinokineospora pegani TaxID=2654637 RepID=UPI0012E9A9A8|nr:PPE domain-containing protein [Actinokineospora pegani]
MTMHRWEGYDHPTLFKMINSGPGPGASTAQTEYWESLAGELEQIDGDLNSKLSTLSVTWEGGAADGAQAGLTPLQAWAADAKGGASVMGASTEYQADAVAKARAEMPEPVAVTTPAPSGWQTVGAGAAAVFGFTGPAEAVIQQAQDHEIQEARQSAASQQAVDTMEKYQSKTNFNTATLGKFVPPPTVVVSTPAPDGGVGYQAGYAFSGGSAFPSGGGGTSAAFYSGAPANGGGGGGFVPPAGGGGGSSLPAPQFTGGQITPTPVNVGGGTTPAGYVPPTGGGAPTTTGMPGLTGGGPGGPGDARFGPGGARFSGTLNLPADGAVRPNGGLAPGASAMGAEESARRAGGLGGSPGSSLAGDAARQNSAMGRGGVAGAGGSVGGGDSVLGSRGGAAGGAAGKGGVGGGMGTGGRGGASTEEEEDFEHASYLVEADDIFGDERTVAPGVLGTDQ